MAREESASDVSIIHSSELSNLVNLSSSSLTGSLYNTHLQQVLQSPQKGNTTKNTIPASTVIYCYVNGGVAI